METHFDIFWLIVAAAVAFSVRGVLRRIRYCRIIKERRGADRPVIILGYLSQPLIHRYNE